MFILYFDGLIRAGMLREGGGTSGTGPGLGTPGSTPTTGGGNIFSRILSTLWNERPGGSGEGDPAGTPSTQNNNVMGKIMMALLLAVMLALLGGNNDSEVGQDDDDGEGRNQIHLTLRSENGNGNNNNDRLARVRELLTQAINALTGEGTGNTQPTAMPMVREEGGIGPGTTVASGTSQTPSPFSAGGSFSPPGPGGAGGSIAGMSMPLMRI